MASADESIKLAREEVSAAVAAQTATAEEAAAARAALVQRAEAAEAAMAAAQEEAAAGRLEGLSQSEGDVAAIEKKLVALQEEAAAAKAAQGKQQGLAEAAKREASGLLSSKVF